MRDFTKKKTFLHNCNETRSCEAAYVLAILRKVIYQHHPKRKILLWHNKNRLSIVAKVIEPATIDKSILNMILNAKSSYAP